MRRYIQDWIDMFDDVVIVPLELRGIGDDRVVAAQHMTGRAKISGVQTELRYAVVYTLSKAARSRGSTGAPKSGWKAVR